MNLMRTLLKHLARELRLQTCSWCLWRYLAQQSRLHYEWGAVQAL